MKKMLIKFKISKCFFCEKEFKNSEEIIILKNSSLLHKKCYEILKKRLKEEKSV